MTRIRSAVPEDAGRLREIYSYYVLDTAVTFEYEAPSAEEFKDRMARVMSRYPYLVITEDGVILGYAYAGPFVGRAAYDRSAEVTIYLDRDARGRGYGRMLYGALEKALGDMGILNLYACIAYPREDDPFLSTDSADFHRHMGYTKVGEFHNCGYKFNRWYDMIWMEKIIGSHDDVPGPVTCFKGLG